VAVGFADRAAVVIAAGFSRNLWVLHISIKFHFEDQGTGNTLILHEHDDDDDDDDIT
jgi:hypothetical protein